jgi:hypothetical protein
MTNKLIIFILSTILISNPLLAIDDNNITCGEPVITQFFPVTDEEGTSVLTEQKSIRECKVKKEIQGPCNSWKSVKEEFTSANEKYDTYESHNYEDSIGSLMAALGAYDQLGHLWSGWHGYCEIGIKTDFSWAQDPMFWANMAMSVMMEGGEEGGFLADTPIGDTVSSFNESMDSVAGGLNDLTGNNLSMLAGDAAGKCLAQFGMGLGKLAYDQLAPTAEPDCDPIDEFCGNEAEQTEEDQIMSIDMKEYIKLKDKLGTVEGSEPPKYKVDEYITILPGETKDEHGNNIIKIRYKKPNEIESFGDKNKKALDESMEEMKKFQLYMSSAMLAINMATCGTPVNSGGPTKSAQTDDSGRASTKNGIGIAIDAIPSSLLTPYGPLIKAGLQLALNVLYSIQEIDSCNNPDDAEDAGSRHEKTQKALKFNLCHTIEKKCVDHCSGVERELYNKLMGHNYCCYDQVLTKVLVEQLKAQLGRDWVHCTGITFKDLKDVSFRQCTNMTELVKDGEKYNFDGAHQEGDYNASKSFQALGHCIDLTDFKDYLRAQIGGDIDMSDFTKLFDEDSM